MTPRSELVFRFFDRAEHHRAAQHVTALRAHIVRELLAWPRADAARTSVLDVGAGDGAVTFGLARDAARLTWLDGSVGMLEAARRSVPAELTCRIEIVEGELATYDHPHDVVVCVGVLAHVASIPEAMAKLGLLTRAGGSLVVELADGDAPLDFPARLAHRVRERMWPKYGYTLRETSLAEIDGLARVHGLARVATRRHWTTPPLVRRIAPRTWQAAFERWTMETPALARHGSSVIARFDKPR